MTLIKSISGFRGTIGGRTGDTLNPVDIAKSVSAYASLREKVINRTFRRKIVVGRDARISGEMVSHVVCGTLMSMGFDVVNIGLASTPTTELAVTMERACGGIIITASHNPRQWNALKFLNEKGEFLPPVEASEVVRLANSCDFEFADVDSLGCYTKNFSYDQRHIELVKDLELVDIDAIRHAVDECAARHQVVLVESAGGLHVPLSSGLLSIDLASQQHWPLILVTCGRLGSINHTLLSLEAAISRRMTIAGIVYNWHSQSDPLIDADTPEYTLQYLRRLGHDLPMVRIPQLVPGQPDPEIDFTAIIP